MLETVSDPPYVKADSHKCDNFVLTVVLKRSIVYLTKFEGTKTSINMYYIPMHWLIVMQTPMHGDVIKDFLFMSFLVKELSQYEKHYIEILVLMPYITISRHNTVTRL